MLKVSIVTDTKELGESISRCLKYVFGIKEFNFLRLLKESGITPEVLKADMWVVEVFPSLELNNPIGFRTIYKFIKSKRILKFLLIFPPIFPESLKNLPEEGLFWWSPCCKTSFPEKLRSILNSKGFTQKEVEDLAKKYPFLLE